MEAGSNTSTVALRLVGVTKREPSAWGYNSATMFLKDKNMGTWPSKLVESLIWDSKIWPWLPRDSNPRMTALATASSNCKRQTPPLVWEGAPQEQDRNCHTSNKDLVVSPDGCFAPRQTGRLTVGLNIILTLTLITMPWRRMGEWMRRSTHSWPRH
jgi:hypothetical protein